MVANYIVSESGVQYSEYQCFLTQKYMMHSLSNKCHKNNMLQFNKKRFINMNKNLCSQKAYNLALGDINK